MRSLVLSLLFAVPVIAAEKAAFPNLPKGVSSLGAVACDGYVYVYGGHSGKVHSYSSDTTLDTFHRIKIADTAKGWEELPGGKHLQGIALVEHGGKVIRLGGMEPRHKAGEKSDIHSTASVQSFDPKSKKWSDLPDMPAARSSHDAVVVGDTLVVVGGWAMAAGKESEWAKETLTLNLADPKAKWQSLKQPFVRRAIVAAALDGKVFAIGGLTEDGTDHSVNVLDLKTGKWADAPKLPGDRMNAFNPAACVADGKLYVNPADGKFYKLAGDKWEEVAAVAKPRYVHRAVAIGGGNMLVLGGASAKDGPRAECEVIAAK